METSLKEYELKNLHEKCINYYNFMFKEPEPPKDETKYNPFFPHPSEYL